MEDNAKTQEKKYIQDDINKHTQEKEICKQNIDDDIKEKQVTEQENKFLRLQYEAGLKKQTEINSRLVNN